MLEVFQHSHVASRKFNLYDFTMAFCDLGDKPNWPLPTTRPTFKYDVVIVDYFTKWAEAKPLAMISSRKVQDFVWEAIICRYDIPQEIISDNGTQFDNKEFREFCEELGIKKSFSLVNHPQTNDQVKAVNTT